MCGRYSLSESGEQVAARFLFELPPGPLPALPRYNIAPGQTVLAVLGAPRRPELLRWGFAPTWLQRAPMINARAETAASGRLFAPAVRGRRCLLPACGFFEWRRDGARRQPVRFSPAAGGLWGLAGIWEPGTPPTVAILTTRPNDLVARVHDRMPVILRPEDEAAWLDLPAADPGALLEAVSRPYPAEAMAAHDVSPLVGDPRHDSAACIAPL